jgi:NDP-sugar pyrophosphorylase family protein
VEVAGNTLLEITLRRLASFGIREVIVNVHHFADMVTEYLKKNNYFGLRVEISRENDLLLDTGGGLKKASWFFLEPRTQEPFLVHNVDVISTIDLVRILKFHRENRGVATLAVQQRETSRRLLFDDRNQLCGRQTGNDAPEIVQPATETSSLAFSGIHVISPELLGMITEQGVFSIITTYLRLAREGHRILGFRADEYYWRDVGKPEHIAKATADIDRGLLTLQ